MSVEPRRSQRTKANLAQTLQIRRSHPSGLSNERRQPRRKQEQTSQTIAIDLFYMLAWHSGLTTDFKHRRTAAFENQRLYGQIECAIGGCLQGIVRPCVRPISGSHSEI